MSASLLLVCITVSAWSPHPAARARATSLPLWPTGCTGARGGEPPGTSRAGSRARARLASRAPVAVHVHVVCVLLFTYFVYCIQFSTHCEGSSLSRSRTHTTFTTATLTTHPLPAGRTDPKPNNIQNTPNQHAPRPGSVHARSTLSLPGDWHACQPSLPPVTQ